MDWLKGGDRNTKYFHMKASTRRSRNAIPGLVDDMGRWCVDIAEMAGIVVNYFSNLFTSVQPAMDVTDRAVGCIQPRLSGRSSCLLDWDFSAEDIRIAVFDISPSKAPGPDGLPGFFFPKILALSWWECY